MSPVAVGLVGSIRARARSVGLVVGLVLPMLAGPVLAQQTGQVTGEVRNDETNEPLVGAQIVLVGTGMGTITNNVGRYLIPGVQPGRYTLQVQMIGYAPQERQIDVQAGEATVVNMALRPRAVELDELVVTGTAGSARRREIGNTVTQVSADAIQRTPVTQITDVLQGRGAGVTVMQNSGSLGSGASIRLRGNNSVNLGNEPLIYVDGVRLSSAVYQADPELNQSPIPFDDLNPADIERIEIVKGAAATTLYGTEAAGGVIQIFTKRGAQGAPAWQFSMDQGLHTMPWLGPDEDINPTGLHLFDCTDDASCPEDGSWFKPGHIQRYNLSVRGGTETTNYFLSARFGVEDGVVDAPSQIPDPPQSDELTPYFGREEPQQLKSFAVRGNFGFSPRDNLTIQFNSAWSHRDIRSIPDGNNAEGFLLNVTRGLAGYTTQDMDGLLFLMKLDQQVDHFITGANMLWNVAPGIDQRLNVGLDYTTTDYREERPWGFYYEPDGDREVDQRMRRHLTVDYTGNWRTEFLRDYSSNFSWGAQLYDYRYWGLNSFAYTFAGPGDKIIQSGTTDSAYESRRTETSGGFFFQEQVGWQDRLFLTAGARFDGFSTFGEGFGLATYPKVQLAYLLSDHDLWPAWWGTMKVRGAVGESGKAPGAFDAERTWEATSGDEQQPALIIANLGNPDLGPEVTREIEGGFDAAMFDDRLSVEFTYYNQRTFDGLIWVQEIPSNGVAESRARNVGDFANSGLELSVDLDAVRSEDLYWSVGGYVSTNHSEVVDLGPLDDIYIGWRQRARPCLDEDDPSTIYRDETKDCPFPAFYDNYVQNPDDVGVEPDMAFSYRGPVYPTLTWGINTTLSLYDRLTLDVLGESQMGHFLSSGVAYQNTRRGEWPSCLEIQEKIDAGNTSDLSTYDWALCDGGYTSYGMWTQPGDFFKLRNIGLSYQLPESWLPAGTRSITLRASARNLLTITDYPGLDPESFEDGATGLYRQEYYNLPPTRTFILNATVNF